MNKNWHLQFHKTAVYLMIITLFITLSTIFVFSGCNLSDDSLNDSPEFSNIESSQNTETEKSIDHNLDLNPSPLPDSNLILSLVGYGAEGALNDSDLTIADMLMYAVQDEYLARGEYLAIIDEFGNQRPYTNILKSEETHLSFLEEVYNSYNIDFPSDTSQEHLIIPSDLLEAAEVGVKAEIDNIEMYEKFLSFDLPENIVNVFTALKNGSESHLLAFQKQVDRLQ